MADSATINTPYGIAVDAYGNLFIADDGNSRIRKVTFNPVITPTITITATAADTICGGTAVTFASIVTGGSTSLFYQWLINGIPAGTGSNYTFTPANGDSIRCMLTVAGLCNIISSNTIVMVVDPVLTPSITVASSASAPVGGTVTVNATVAGAGSSYNINWYKNGLLFNSTTTPIVTYTKTAGADLITATVIPVATGVPVECYDSSTSSAFAITSINEAVSTSGVSQVYIYPNPANDLLNINNIKAQTTYQILSVVGEPVQQGTLKEGNNTISIQTLSPGMYVLVLTNNEGERTVRKIVKE